MKHTTISFNICTQFFITHFHTQSSQWDIFDEREICLILKFLNVMFNKFTHKREKWNWMIVRRRRWWRFFRDRNYSREFPVIRESSWGDGQVEVTKGRLWRLQCFIASWKICHQGQTTEPHQRRSQTGRWTSWKNKRSYWAQMLWKICYLH